MTLDITDEALQAKNDKVRSAARARPCAQLLALPAIFECAVGNCLLGRRANSLARASSSPGCPRKQLCRCGGVIVRVPVCGQPGRFIAASAAHQLVQWGLHPGSGCESRTN